MDNNKLKYLKYKSKYLNLKNQIGGLEKGDYVKINNNIIKCNGNKGLNIVKVEKELDNNNVLVSGNRKVNKDNITEIEYSFRKIDNRKRCTYIKDKKTGEISQIINVNKNIMKLNNGRNINIDDNFTNNFEYGTIRNPNEVTPDDEIDMTGVTKDWCENNFLPNPRNDYKPSMNITGEFTNFYSFYIMIEFDDIKNSTYKYITSLRKSILKSELNESIHISLCDIKVNKKYWDFDQNLKTLNEKPKEGDTPLKKLIDNGFWQLIHGDIGTIINNINTLKKQLKLAVKNQIETHLDQKDIEFIHKKMTYYGPKNESDSGFYAIELKEKGGDKNNIYIFRNNVLQIFLAYCNAINVIYDLLFKNDDNKLYRRELLIDANHYNIYQNTSGNFIFYINLNQQIPNIKNIRNRDNDKLNFSIADPKHIEKNRSIYFEIQNVNTTVDDRISLEKYGIALLDFNCSNKQRPLVMRESTNNYLPHISVTPPFNIEKSNKPLYDKLNSYGKIRIKNTDSTNLLNRDLMVEYLENKLSDKNTKNMPKLEIVKISKNKIIFSKTDLDFKKDKKDKEGKEGKDGPITIIDIYQLK